MTKAEADKYREADIERCPRCRHLSVMVYRDAKECTQRDCGYRDPKIPVPVEQLLQERSG